MANLKSSLLFATVALVGIVRGQVQCNWDEAQSILKITDAATSSEVRDCAVSTSADTFLTLEITSPSLTVLEQGVLSGFAVGKLRIIADNLVTIQSGILDFFDDRVQAVFTDLYVKSNELLELNEAQFSTCYNLWSVIIDGTKLTSLSFAFTAGSNIREVKLLNTATLNTIDKVLGNIMGTYVFENTGIQELPTYMFERHVVASQDVTFRNNPQLTALRENVFSRGYGYLQVSFYDTPIQTIEPGFIDLKTYGAEILLAGNQVGVFDRAVFEPILEDWRMKNLPSNVTWIKWNTDEEETSLQIICDCSINWLATDPDIVKYVQNTFCESGRNVQKLSALDFASCFDCPADTGLYPDPTECRYFFQCSAGVPYLKKCPDGLIFNADRNRCDWPYNVAPPCGTATYHRH